MPQPPFFIKNNKMAVKKSNKKDGKSSSENNSVFEDSHTGETVGNTTEEASNTHNEKEPSMPMSAVEGLLQRMEEKLTNHFNSKIRKLQLGSAKEDMSAGADYIADLEDDWLDIPVVFFAYSINFSIHGDNNLGKSTKPPHGAVRFKPIIRTKRPGKGRRGEEVISVSSIKVHSKSVVEYLRSHSQFGLAFFENMDSVLNIDSGWAQRLIEANQSIQRLSDQQIIARCRQEEIPVGTDIIKMRKALVENIAEKSLAKQREMSYGKLEKAVVDKNNAQGAERQIIQRTIK